MAPTYIHTGLRGIYTTVIAVLFIFNGLCIVEIVRDFIIKKLEEKGAENIVLLNLDGKSTIARDMVFCDGKSYKHVSSLGDILSLEIKNEFSIDVAIEGVGSSTGWVVLDCSDIIVNIFHPETRDYYRLYEHWAKKANISTQHKD